MYAIKEYKIEIYDDQLLLYPLAYSETILFLRTSKLSDNNAKRKRKV